MKTYIVWLFPGSFLSEESHSAVADRSDPKDVPPRSFGYYFYDRRETVVDGETLVGKPMNQSGTTYFGRKMTVEDVEREPGDHRTLLLNMRSNDWPVVVKTVRGNYQPLRTQDRVIAP